SASSRARIIDILAASDDKAAGKAMLDVLETEVPPEVRQKVLANLKLFLPGKWKDLRGSKEVDTLIARLLDKSATRIAGLELIAAVEPSGAARQVEKIALDSKEDQAVRVAAARALGALPFDDSVQALTKLSHGSQAQLLQATTQALGQLASLTSKQQQKVAQEALKALKGLFLE